MQQLESATARSCSGCTDVSGGAGLDTSRRAGKYSLSGLLSVSDAVSSAFTSGNEFDAQRFAIQHALSGGADEQQESWPESGAASRFRTLVARWREERGITSSPFVMFECPAYRQILAMGPRAVPLILDSLRQDGPDHWFSALAILTGEDPISPDMYGYMDKMTEAWIRWDDARKSAGTDPH